MEKLRTYKDFSTLAVEMERAGAWATAEAAWKKAAIVARKSENEEWALNRQKMCAHYVRYPNRRPEVRHG